MEFMIGMYTEEYRQQLIQAYGYHGFPMDGATFPITHAQLESWIAMNHPEWRVQIEDVSMAIADQHHAYLFSLRSFTWRPNPARQFDESVSFNFWFTLNHVRAESLELFHQQTSSAGSLILFSTQDYLPLILEPHRIYDYQHLTDDYHDSYMTNTPHVFFDRWYP